MNLFCVSSRNDRSHPIRSRASGASTIASLPPQSRPFPPAGTGVARPVTSGTATP